MQEEESFEEVAGAICLQVYRETLRGVVTACRRYKDELLESCLQLVLSAPTPVMTIHVKPAIPIYRLHCSCSWPCHLVAVSFPCFSLRDYVQPNSQLTFGLCPQWQVSHAISMLYTMSTLC